MVQRSEEQRKPSSEIYMCHCEILPIPTTAAWLILRELPPFQAWPATVIKELKQLWLQHGWDNNTLTESPSHFKWSNSCFYSVNSLQLWTFLFLFILWISLGITDMHSYASHRNSLFLEGNTREMQMFSSTQSLYVYWARESRCKLCPKNLKIIFT